MENKNKWKLLHAIHNGTITSRDIGNPEHFDTEAEAMAAFYKHRKFYRSIGYMIWFATLTSPEGKETQLESNPYRS